MKNTNRKYTFGLLSLLKKNKRAIFSIELAIILPLITVLALGGLEYAGLIKKDQILIQVARDYSNAAMSECGDISFSPNQNAMTTCIEAVRDQINASAKALIKDFDTQGYLIMTMFVDSDPGDDTDDPTDKKHYIQIGIGGTPHNSRFIHGDDDYLDVPGEISFKDDLFNKKPSIAIAEVFYKYKLITPFGLLINAMGDDKDDTLYETAIF